MLAWPCKQLPSLGFSPVTTVGAESSLTSNLKEVCQQTALTPDLQIVMSKKIHSQICGKPRNVNSSQTQTCKRYCIRYIHFIPPFMKVEYLNKVTTEKKKKLSWRREILFKDWLQWIAGTSLFHSQWDYGDQKCSAAEHKPDWHNTATQAPWELLRRPTAGLSCRYFHVISKPRKNIHISNICLSLSIF